MARSLEREFFRVGYHFTMQEIQDAFRKADASEEAFNKDIARLGTPSWKPFPETEKGGTLE